MWSDHYSAERLSLSGHSKQSAVGSGHRWLNQFLYQALLVRRVHKHLSKQTFERMNLIVESTAILNNGIYWDSIFMYAASEVMTCHRLADGLSDWFQGYCGHVPDGIISHTSVTKESRQFSCSLIWTGMDSIWWMMIMTSPSPIDQRWDFNSPVVSRRER